MKMSTLYALPIYARKTCTGLLCALGMMFLATAAFSQTSGFQSEIGDLSGKQWKSGGSLTTTIAAEKTAAQAMIAAPDTHPDDKAIQTYYIGVLDRLEVQLQSGVSLSDALSKAFEETAAAAVNDPATKSVVPETVLPLMHTLVERLQEVPQFVPATN